MCPNICQPCPRLYKPPAEGPSTELRMQLRRPLRSLLYAFFIPQPDSH